MMSVAPAKFRTREEMDDFGRRYLAGEMLGADDLRDLRNSTATPVWSDMRIQRAKQMQAERIAACAEAIGDGKTVEEKLDAVIGQLMLGLER